MTTLANYMPQGLLLAGTLSLANAAGCGTSTQTNTEEQALASASASVAAPASSSSANTVDIPLQGRAGIATMCIETRSYVDPQSGKIITPSIYISKMPAEGIDTLYFKGSPAALKWEQFLKPANEERKAWLNDTDIPAQANAAFDLMKKLDKDGNGIVTAAEFEKGEKGVSKEDQLTDLAFLMSLRCDNLFLNEGPLNTVNPEDFPVVQGLRTELAATKETAKKKIRDTQAELEQTQYALYGASILSGLLAVGLISSKIRNRRLQKAEGGPTPAQPSTGTQVPAQTRSESAATAAPNAPAPVAQSSFDAVLEALQDAPTPPPLPDTPPKI